MLPSWLGSHSFDLYQESNSLLCGKAKIMAAALRSLSDGPFKTSLDWVMSKRKSERGVCVLYMSPVPNYRNHLIRYEVFWVPIFIASHSSLSLQQMLCLFIVHALQISSFIRWTWKAGWIVEITNGCTELWKAALTYLRRGQKINLLMDQFICKIKHYAVFVCVLVHERERESEEKSCSVLHNTRIKTKRGDNVS